VSVTYYLKDERTQHALLSQHAQMVHDLNKVRAAKKLPLINFDYPRALGLMRKRIAEFYRGTSKYGPHQGKRECARRRRQMGIES